MKARKTASFGQAYNYSQIDYPYQKMPFYLQDVCLAIEKTIGFKPNNCLINLYENGTSSMGYHSDQIDILSQNTGVAIVSLGARRSLRFRRIEDKEEKIDYELPDGSLIYMDQHVQRIWQHAVPRTQIQDARMSLTFRKLK